MAPTSAETPTRDRAAIQAERAELATRIAALRGAGASEPDAAEASLLETLDRFLSQELDERSRAEQLSEEIEAAQQALGDDIAKELERDPPYSLPLLDEWSDQVEELEGRSQALIRTVDDAQSALRDAQERQEADESARRLRNEELESAPPGAERGRLQRELELAALQSSVSRARVAWRRAVLQNARSAQRLHELRLERARAVREWIATQLQPSEGDLERVLAELEKRRFALERRAEAAALDLSAAESRYAERQRQAGGVAEPGPALTAELAAHRLDVTTRRQEGVLLADQIQRLETAAQVWRRRYANRLAAPARDELAAWRDETRRWLEEAERERRLRAARLAELRGDLTRIREQLERPGDAPARPWLEHEARILGELIHAYETDLESLERTSRLQARLGADLEPKLARFDLGAWLSDLGRTTRAIWRYEIVASEDNPITVGKVVTALGFFALGYLVARILSHSLGARVFPRIRIEEGIAHAYQSLVFYGLIVVAFLVALRVVNIPLTAFAIAGGALAIGIGFGSQNLMNNFISGVILLAERPIKIGDLIDVEGIYGTVERIGLRSTRIRAGENFHVIVPNAAFLENRVINWTHADRQVRIHVAVGVVYGSPTERVVELLQQALGEHPAILDKPEPIILFTEFGDNSLNFEAHFWIRIRSQMERRRVESDLRFRIDQLFRAEDIVIAFPQRDVHLDAPAPIDVRIVNGKPKEEA